MSEKNFLTQSTHNKLVRNQNNWSGRKAYNVQFKRQQLQHRCSLAGVSLRSLNAQNLNHNYVHWLCNSWVIVQLILGHCQVFLYANLVLLTLVVAEYLKLGKSLLWLNLCRQLDLNLVLRHSVLSPGGFISSQAGWEQSLTI